MPNVSQHREIQRWPEAAPHEASTLTVAVVMAGIFAFFIAGIASPFTRAKDTDRTRTAAMPKPIVSGAAPAETTGSAGAPGAQVAK